MKTNKDRDRAVRRHWRNSPACL